MNRVTDALLYPWLYKGRWTKAGGGGGGVAVQWLPFVFLTSFLSLSGLSRRIRELDPESEKDQSCSLKYWGGRGGGVSSGGGLCGASPLTVNQSILHYKFEEKPLVKVSACAYYTAVGPTGRPSFCDITE